VLFLTVNQEFGYTFIYKENTKYFWKINKKQLNTCFIYFPKKKEKKEKKNFFSFYIYPFLLLIIIY